MPHTMTVVAIRAIFTDEWVAVEVTRVDQADVPVAGVVLVHSSDKATVHQVVKAHLAQHPTARLCIFFNGDPMPAGVGVAFALG